MRALIISRDLNRLEVLTKLLIQNNYDLSVCSSGPEVLAVLDGERYPLIILDAVDPAVPAEKTCRMLKSHDAGRTALLLLLTENPDPRLVATLADEGVDSHIDLDWHPDLIASHVAFIGKMTNNLLQRIRAEESSWDAAERFRDLAEYSPNMIFINANGKLVYVNEACVRIMGYSRAEYYDDSFDFRILIAPEDRQRMQENYLKHLRGEEEIEAEYVIQTRDGERIHAITHTRMITYRGMNAILGIITDVTSYRLAMRRLRESGERFRSIIASSPAGIFQSTPEGRILFVNESWARKMRFDSPGEMLNRSAETFYADPNDRRRFLELLGERKGEVYFRFIAVRGDGSRIPVIQVATLEEGVISGVFIEDRPV